jgi:hypothetical protein
MEAVWVVIEPGVVLCRMIGSFSGLDGGRKSGAVVENGRRGGRGEEAFEREGEERGDFVDVQFGLRREASVQEDEDSGEARTRRE